MQFYQVIFEEGGEIVQTISLPAISPEDAIRRVEQTRLDHPSLNHIQPGSGVTVRVDLVPQKLSEARLSELEVAVLEELIRQAPSDAVEALLAQIDSITGVTRRNTGAGFYTALYVSRDTPRVNLRSPFGDVGAKVMAFNWGSCFGSRMDTPTSLRPTPMGSATTPPSSTWRTSASPGLDRGRRRL